MACLSARVCGGAFDLGLGLRIRVEEHEPSGMIPPEMHLTQQNPFLHVSIVFVCVDL